MNGFQLSFIESILEISSYHLRAGPVEIEYTKDAGDELLKVPGIEAVVPFREFQALVRGRRGGQQAAFVRGVPVNAVSLDPGMANRLEFIEGFFDVSDDKSILIGSELSRRLGVRTGNEITMFSIPSIFSVAETEEENAVYSVFTVSGIFTSGYYEYDTSWIFMNIDSALVFSETDPVMGIKLKNRYNDQKMLEHAGKILEGLPGCENAVLSSWRDYNRSFFGALRTEKLFMFILVGLIFIVVGLNIYQSQRRAVLERREEMGLLRAIGGSKTSVRLIFILDGAIIGFTGASIGLVLGLLIASDISRFFTGVEIIVNFLINIINTVANIFNAGGLDDFSIFSPAVFYIKEIPSRIISGEAVLIFMFGLFSALIAAWFASRKVSRLRPAEVLRNE